MEKLIEWMDGARGRRLFLAESLKIGASAISQWTRVPSERVADVERLTGIPRETLRPDIFKQGADA